MDFELDAPSGPPGFPPIDFRALLNDEQFAAVTAPPGQSLKTVSTMSSAAPSPTCIAASAS
jgi:hypothetical protein